jgi:serine protease AprX
MHRRSHWIRIALATSLTLACAAVAPPTSRHAAPVRGFEPLQNSFAPATQVSAGALYELTKITGTQSAWSRSDAAGRKVTGYGVGVALIDSGVDKVEGLDGDRVVDGPDLTVDAASEFARDDRYGHGTHLAGIIAGRDSVVEPGSENTPDHFVGVAPDATLVSIKVADVDGTTDLDRIVAALDWVVEHRDDNAMNVRVITLAFGADATDPYEIDPLAAAVERAWHAGIVVVVAAGNSGPGSTALTSPAIDPYVLAIGAFDPHANEDATDDTIADFSSRGSQSRAPDLVAPGRSIASLAALDATVVNENPGSLNGRFLLGSGTSQAAAVVSGAAALLLQQDPTLTPDQVKAMLVAAADPIDGVDATLQGAGRLDVKEAIEGTVPDAAEVAQQYPRAFTDADFSLTADTSSGAWDGRTWSGGAWTGRTWSGGTWTGHTWSAGTWTGRTWSAGTWTGRTWSAGTWTGRTWSAGAWQ